jgi:hypothetical protein
MNIDEHAFDRVVGQVYFGATRYLEGLELTAEILEVLVKHYSGSDDITVDNVLTAAEKSEDFWILIKSELELGLGVCVFKMGPKCFKNMAWDFRNNFGHRPANDFWQLAFSK